MGSTATLVSAMMNGRSGMYSPKLGLLSKSRVLGGFDWGNFIARCWLGEGARFT
jgi:hypothetical protein